MKDRVQSQQKMNHYILPIAMILLAALFMGIRSCTDVPVPSSSTAKPVKAYRKFEGAAQELAELGIRSVTLGKVNFEYTPLYQGKWPQTEIAKFDSIFQQNHVFLGELRTGITEALSPVGISVTDSPDSDAIFTGNCGIYFFAKRFSFGPLKFDSGSVAQHIYLELRTSTTNKLIAVFSLEDNQKL